MDSEAPELMLNAHETGMLGFLEERQRRRIRALFELGPKGRQKVRQYLDHEMRFDPRHVVPLTGLESLPPRILKRLQESGAPEQCFIVSSDQRIDGREMRLADAIDAVIASASGSCISCIPGKLAYWQGEDIGTSCILRR